MDVERLPLEFHDDGLLYCFDSDELYTGVWKKSLAGVIVEEGFYSDGLADGKWIYRNQDNSIKFNSIMIYQKFNIITIYRWVRRF